LRCISGRYFLVLLIVYNLYLVNHSGSANASGLCYCTWLDVRPYCLIQRWISRGSSRTNDSNIYSTIDTSIPFPRSCPLTDPLLDPQVVERYLEGPQPSIPLGSSSRPRKPATACDALSPHEKIASAFGRARAAKPGFLCFALNCMTDLCPCRSVLLYGVWWPNLGKSRRPGDHGCEDDLDGVKGVAISGFWSCFLGF
jgi:hypothetical protein